MLNKFIIPAAVSSKPIPENPAVNTILSSMVAVKSKDPSQPFTETSEKEDPAEDAEVDDARDGDQVVPKRISKITVIVGYGF